jgi:hypothetical protein
MKRNTGYNSTFAIGRVSCSADIFVAKGSSVLRMNICAGKPAHRKSAKRYASPNNDFANTNHNTKQTDKWKLTL